MFLTELLAAAQRTDGLEELPDSVEALMIREIDRLSPPARRLLRSAAVVGATFDLDLLRTCLGEPWDDETWTSLEPFMVAQEGDAFGSGTCSLATRRTKVSPTAADGSCTRASGTS